jgi:hypothetical protein
MRPVTRLVAALFALGAVVHVVRLFTGFPIVVGGFSVPVWASLPVAAIAALLAFALQREARQR